MTHSYVRHDSFVCVTWLIVRGGERERDSFMCGTWLINVWDMTHSCDDMTHAYMWSDSPLRWVTSHICMSHGVTSHICMSHDDSFICEDANVTHSCVRRDSPGEVEEGNVTHSYVTHSYFRHDLFVCATWLLHFCDVTYSCARCESQWEVEGGTMSHSYVRHDSFIFHVRRDSSIWQAWLPVRGGGR